MALCISIGLTAACALSLPAPARAQTRIDFGKNAPLPADDQAIRQLLTAYTTAVSDGDEAAFKTLLLDERIPFTGVGSRISSTADRPYDDRNFAGFDDEIFKSGVRYTQSFYNIHILQDGLLAQVSLDFVTREASSANGGWGWKILQLVKVDGAWKIASEFYTGHALAPR